MVFLASGSFEKIELADSCNHHHSRIQANSWQRLRWAAYRISVDVELCPGSEIPESLAFAMNHAHRRVAEPTADGASHDGESGNVLC